MEYKEDVRTFLKRDFSVLAVRSGQNKVDLIKGTKDIFKGVKTNNRIEYAKNITTCTIKAIKSCSEKS